jgi:AcrR family transcriptional regulator
MPRTPASEPRHDGKRDAIRHAAYRTFLAHGYHDTSIDRICAEAGISKGSLYWHYESKQAIFVDLIESWAREVMDEVYARFEAASQHQGDLVTFLRAALKSEARRGLALVPLWLELSAIGRHDPAIQVALAKVYRRARSAIVEVLRPVTPHQTDPQRRGLAAAVFGAFTGIIMQAMVDPQGADADELLEGFMSLIEHWLIRTGSLEPRR